MDSEMEDEEEEESCQAGTKPIPSENKQSAQYYNWSSTGTELKMMVSAKMKTILQQRKSLRKNM